MLLRVAAQRVRSTAYEIGNIDATIIAQAPKMAPHLPRMIAQIAADLAVSEAQINLKAKTNERLGWEGREEGIAAQAIALLLQK
jgi:2-C-methyl-D-erythritol 2,4-cyclodiphosphate synthase